MSALGQKQTYAAQQSMSALPPIATKKANITPHRFCGLRTNREAAPRTETTVVQATALYFDSAMHLFTKRA